ncbi:hypothetical protein [Craterilacuibacter sp.]|uniref:hypothetical protein n=1 Tax=Craterilacuibacter sp. TaxID=2870909 RepID=UPI003F33C4B9
MMEKKPAVPVFFGMTFALYGGAIGCRALTWQGVPIFSFKAGALQASKTRAFGVLWLATIGISLIFQ